MAEKKVELELVITNERVLRDLLEAVEHIEQALEETPWRAEWRRAADCLERAARHIRYVPVPRLELDLTGDRSVGPA